MLSLSKSNVFLPDVSSNEILTHIFLGLSSSITGPDNDVFIVKEVKRDVTIYFTYIRCTFPFVVQNLYNKLDRNQ